MAEIEKAQAGTSHEDVVAPATLDRTTVAPPITIRTFILVLAIDIIYFVQLVNLVGSGSLGQAIITLAGGKGNTVWFTSSVTIATAVLSPPVCQAADYWGRKWLTVCLTALGFVGSMVVSRAESYGTFLAGFVIIAIAYGAQPLLYAICSEVVPRKHRSYAQASIQISGSAGGIVGLMMGGSLTKSNGLEGIRTYWYICAGLFAFATIACALFYNPPPRDLQFTLKTSEKLHILDWPAYGLLTVGLVLFCIGLSWSQNPFEWTNAHILAPFTLGVLFIILLLGYSWKIRTDGMIHHRLFQHCNFPVALFCLFTEGLAFFSCNNYFAFEISVLFTSDPVQVGGHFSILFVALIVGAFFSGWYTWKTRTVRLPTIVAFGLFIIFFFLMATITTDTPERNIWGYPILVGVGLGINITSLLVAAQLATPPELIAITSGLISTVRNVGGTVGLTIFTAIFNHGIESNLTSKVAAAVVPLGFSATGLAELIPALLSGNPTALRNIPGASPEIIAAAGVAVQQAYVIAFRYVWIAGGAFSVAALVGACFVYDPKSAFNHEIDAPAEGRSIHVAESKALSEIEESTGRV